MADVEMKADNKAAGAEEEKKEEEQKIEEPTDHYYGKQQCEANLFPNSDYCEASMNANWFTFCVNRAKEVFGYPGEGWKGERL